jgi:hypothetical protein
VVLKSNAPGRVELSARRPNVAVHENQHMGNGKVATHPVAVWFRDLVLPFFIKQGAKASEAVLAYKVEWEKEVT